MNFTLYALFTSRLSTSPMFMIPSKFDKSSIRIDKSFAHNFFTSFLFTQTNKLSAFIRQSSFSNFLQSPLSFRMAEMDGCSINQFINQKFSGSQVTFKSCSNDVSIIECTFQNSEVSGNGAGIYSEIASTFTCHGSIFSGCKANGDGGGIYAKSATNFHSDYCCYSSSKGSHGSAANILASKIQIKFTTASKCTGYGAQVDLDSGEITSSSINCTSGVSTYCASLEYRNTNTGHFQYQTIINQEGVFITSFTGLKHSVEISNCNFVNNKVIDVNNPSDQSSIPGVIHVIDNPVIIKSFYFYDIHMESSKGKLISSNGLSTSGDLYDSYIDNANVNFDGVNTHNVHIVAANARPPTHTIRQLNLGDCKAGVPKTVPPFGVVDNDDPMPEHYESIDGGIGGNGNGNGPNNNGGNNKKGTSPGVIAGATIGSAAGAGGIIGGVVYYFKRKKSPVG